MLLSRIRPNLTNRPLLFKLSRPWNPFFKVKYSTDLHHRFEIGNIRMTGDAVVEYRLFFSLSHLGSKITLKLRYSFNQSLKQYKLLYVNVFI
jgi:hypothetical protein